MCTLPSGPAKQVDFFVDSELVRTVTRSPAYPMQLMLGIYEVPLETRLESAPGTYPKQFVVDYVRYVRGYSLSAQEHVLSAPLRLSAPFRADLQPYPR
jgi:hypothetical protein